MNTVLGSLLFLIAWTLMVWVLMYVTRFPAMKKAKIAPQDALHASVFTTLPSKVRVVSDNYSHLHEQPTIFYALAIYTHLAGVADSLSVLLAWGYVLLRVVHSIIQIFLRNVSLRFIVFALSTIILMIITFRNIVALLA